jgi:hypothetical protein
VLRKAAEKTKKRIFSAVSAALREKNTIKL